MSLLSLRHEALEELQNRYRSTRIKRGLMCIENHIQSIFPLGKLEPLHWIPSIFANSCEDIP